MKTVAIVGKPNVGKSTLFNRIINKKKSIIHDSAGVTRDRIYDEAEWLCRKFELIDTGGLTSKKLTFQENINEQVLFAIEEADIIIFLLSNETGLDNDDFFVNKILKKYKNKKEVILAVNKLDSKTIVDKDSYYQLGYGKPIFISSSHGIGTGDLLDAIVAKIPQTQEEIVYEKNYSFAIIGKPNVGKSSLVNAMVKENKVIVSDVAGSTRDSTDTEFKYYNETFTITDTAGIRRKGKIKENLEKFALLRAEMAIKKSNVILFMIDGSQEISEQDEVIGGLAYSANIPSIIVVNKIDLIPNFDETKKKEIIQMIRNRFKFLSWAPIVFISSAQNLKINKLMEKILEIRDKVKVKINNSLLNEVVLKAQMLQEAPIFKGNRLSISYITQIKSQIPTFVIFCNNPKYLHFSYARYIENKIRESFGLNDVPVCLYWKDKNAKTRGLKGE
ncbi:MAG: ribosome biogenesis GTPase Der [Ureaplasma sp.]|nr:ribosome biogenesis GTPase Der [Ureaplasma sp.]MDE6289414.1 ribosome biogenesis GTPase Der [Ureaplasma sp.]